MIKAIKSSLEEMNHLHKSYASYEIEALTLLSKMNYGIYYRLYVELDDVRVYSHSKDEEEMLDMLQELKELQISHPMDIIESRQDWLTVQRKIKLPSDLQDLKEKMIRNGEFHEKEHF